MNCCPTVDSAPTIPTAASGSAPADFIPGKAGDHDQPYVYVKPAVESVGQFSQRQMARLMILKSAIEAGLVHDGNEVGE